MKLRFVGVTMAMVLFTGTILLLNSCNKHEDETPATNNTAPTLTKAEQEQVIKQLIKKMPELKMIVDKQARQVQQPGGFNFADPNPGFNYSSSTGANYVEADHSLYLDASAFGKNSAGGTVVAGSTSLNINYTFCFSASEEGLGLDLFGMMDGVSSVIGISGDFEAIMNGEVEGENAMEYFNGIAMYMVFDNEAQGSYDVVNFIDNKSADENSLEGNAFAIVIDIKNMKIYLSNEGTLNVSGGSISFNGSYLEISDFDFNSDLGDDVSWKEVSGFGSMGCN